MIMKRLQRTSPSPAMEDDDLLAEFLLRLPPQPSALPRAGLVCKRWRRVVTDPRFVRRFRSFHRRTPPLHGFITRAGVFVPTQEPPDRLPPSRFWRDRWCGEADGFQHRWSVHCCRHGLVLCCRAEEFATEFLVVDPMAGHRGSRIRIGILHHEGAFLVAATVVSVAGGGDRRAFLIVALLAHDLETRRARTRLTASVYSSDSGAWRASSVAAVFPPSADIRRIQRPSILRSRRCRGAILGPGSCRCRQRQLAMMGMAMAAASVSPFCADSASSSGRGRPDLSDDAAKWVLCKTVQLDKVLPVQLARALPLGISGFDEESNAIFLWTHEGVFMTHIDSISMQFKKVFGGRAIGTYLHPYTSV